MAGTLTHKKTTASGVATPDSDKASAFVDSADELPKWRDESGVLMSAGNFCGAPISPAQLVANTDNWNPTGLSTAGFIRLSTDASRNLTGIVAPTTEKWLTLANIGAFDIVLKHDATSTAANRFYTPNNADFTIRQNGCARIFYDATSSRWRVIGA